MAMNDLTALKLFVRVARKGSFTAGGRDLRIPQPTVSRLISILEREIGAPLFTRTTRAVTLTDVGADFLARVEPLLASLDEAIHAAGGGAALKGMLRVGLSSSFAMRGVVPRLSAFMRLHPDLRIELLTNDQRQHLVADGVDVALRFGPLEDSTAVARRLSTWPRIIAASPAYLALQGVPTVPADLTDHVIVAGPASNSLDWSFHNRAKGASTSVRVGGPLTVTVNEVSVAAAVAGHGIVSMSLMGCRRELDRGELVRLLPDWDMGEIELHAVFAGSRAVKPAARAFVDFLFVELRDRPI